MVCADFTMVGAVACAGGSGSIDNKLHGLLNCGFDQAQDVVTNNK